MIGTVLENGICASGLLRQHVYANMQQAPVADHNALEFQIVFLRAYMYWRGMVESPRLPRTGRFCKAYD
jgi:hypothetical protein